MFIRLVGLFEVRDKMGLDRTPRGAKARALLAMLCQTPDHRRPRRWLERKLWSDRGQEQASGSLRQALTELRKSLGPLAPHLVSDRDCVALEGFDTDLADHPDAARTAIRDGREFLEGIDIVDGAFLDWLAAERVRVSTQLDLRDEVMVPKREYDSEARSEGRQSPIQDVRKSTLARDLAAAIARLTAEYLFLDQAEAERDGKPQGFTGKGLDLQVEGAWSDDRAHLSVRLVAQANRKTLWSQRLRASRSGDEAGGYRGVPTVVFEAGEAVLM